VPTRNRQQFIAGQIAWQMAAILCLTLLNALSLELFFVISLIGILIIVEITAPFRLAPRWRQRLKWIIGAGLLLFGYVVVHRISEILPAGVV
jgi:hypothetical protein